MLALTGYAYELKVAYYVELIGLLKWCLIVDFFIGGALHLYLKRVPQLREFMSTEWEGLKYYVFGDLQKIPNRWARYLAYALRPITFCWMFCIGLMVASQIVFVFIE